MDDLVAIAAAELAAGRLVAFPTETVYGLGADASDPKAIASVYAVKGRPSFNPLIAHVASLDAAEREAVLPPGALRLAARFWPGPLTLVVPRAPGGCVCDLACAGYATIGLRVPDHPLALALLERVGRPIAAPSANASGRLSPTSAADVRASLGNQFGRILDGGECRVGLESTIVGFVDDRAALLRPGGISREAIEAILGYALAPAGAEVRAPGMLASHYAPNARLRLDATDLRPHEVGLDFGGIFGRAGTRDLSRTGDLTEAAANLYRDLRALDASGAATIAVAPIPRTGLGLAIVDRLQRAAAPRPT